ncbi:hypothetical protein A6R68_18719 [Neotoma lepida]|uniref:G-protein coupled receptors family 1 profile domain-containing protein n=1 Tax=Neotoma lepida TaxID=56216 RepID=A0A1A6HMD4_NEOLE|nr:hypothetical protein A6R68_18719 [Neotoma lepida]
MLQSAQSPPTAEATNYFPTTMSTNLSEDNNTQPTITFSEPLHMLHMLLPTVYSMICAVNISEYLLQHWPFGEPFCKLVLTFNHYNILSSICFLVVMSVDCYLMVLVLVTVKSCRLPRHTQRGAKVTSLCIWLSVTIMGLPFFSFAYVYSNEL